MRRQSVDLIVVPYNVERDDVPMARAPLALLDHGFEEALRARGIATKTRTVAPTRHAGGAKARKVGNLARVLSGSVRQSIRSGHFPLVLAGGCLSAIGVSTALRRRQHRVSVVWVDAHGDFNDEASSPSGYWDGMALAAVCGLALAEVRATAGAKPVPPARVAHLGGRDLDPPEKRAFQEHGVLVLPPPTLALPAARRQLAGHVGHTRELYLHIDLDGLDPSEAPAVGFPTPRGIARDDLLATVRALPRASALTLAAMSFAGQSQAAARQTVDTALALTEAALDRRSSTSSFEQQV